MKTITMDYETYMEEIAYEQESGKNVGVSDVMKFLESKKPLREWLLENNWISGHALLTDEDIKEMCENWHWVRIAKACGRSIE